MAKHALAITLAIFAVLAAIVFVRYAPPTSGDVNAPTDRFSGARARLVQEKLVGDGATRWAGTEGNEKGRAVIVAELEKSGWQVETQKALSCTFYGLCTPVANVVAHLDGTQPLLPGVLISAHHDSVMAGPGASDDGIGVATIVETARALAAGPRPKRTVVALLTDGEEAGLAGADAFVRMHPLAGKVRMTVNIDARGSTGPSSMFETSRGNAWIAPMLSNYLERPVTTSLFYEVYRRMPNDTDFSVTKQIASGINFANIEKIENYHTPHDDLAHSDQGTLQHHGDHVLGMTRAFANGEMSTGDAGDAVWFDVLAIFLVYWPAKWSLLLAIIALALLAGHALRGRFRDRGLTAFLMMIVPAGLAAAGLGWLLKAIGALPSPWFAHAEPARAVLEIGPAALVLAIGAAVANKASPRSVWVGTWIGWGVLGLVTANLAPGASYLFIVPALAAGILGSAPFPYACVGPAAVAGVLVLSLRVGLYEALGFAIAPLLALPGILLATTLAPMLATLPRRVAPALGAVAACALLVARMVPNYSSEHPQRANVIFRQDESGARAFVDTGWGAATWGPAPAAMRAAIGGTGDAPPFPWARPAAVAAEQPVMVREPVFEVTSAIDENGHHKLKGRVRSPRGAPMVAFYFPKDRQLEVRVSGRFAYPRVVGNGKLLGIIAPPADGMPVEIDALGEGALPFELFDRSAGVPSDSKAAAALKARPPEATAFQDGDVTVVSTKLSL